MMGYLVQSSLVWINDVLTSDILDIPLKVESLSTALAINFGLLPIAYLAYSEKILDFTISGTSFEYATYFDIIR
jgi:hypothetical protein